jgi:hypothetical protein
MVTSETRYSFRHFPLVLDKLEDMPEELFELYRPHAGNNGSPKLIIYIPQQSFLKRFFGQRIVPRQVLIFNSGFTAQVQAGLTGQEEGKVRIIKTEDISCTRIQLLLLYGRLEIFQPLNGSVPSGNGRSIITAEYNTTTFHLIKPGLRDLIKNTWKNGKKTPAKKGMRLNELLEDEAFKKLPFKVRSGMSYYALHPEERVKEMLFQPEVRRARIKLIPKTLIAFTDRQIVFLEDLLNSPYGWIITYLQKSKDLHLDIDQVNRIVSILNIDLSNGSGEKKIQVRLDATIAEKFMDYWESI